MIDPQTGIDVVALSREIKDLQRQGIVLPFTVGPFEAYTLIAALQGASRNPMLSQNQQSLVVGFARQIADSMIRAAAALHGADSLIARTIEMGFQPEYDVTRAGGGA